MLQIFLQSSILVKNMQVNMKFLLFLQNYPILICEYFGAICAN